MTQVIKSLMTIKEVNENISFGGLVRLGTSGQFLILSECDEMDIKYFYAVRFDEIFESSSKDELVKFANNETFRIVNEATKAMPKINANKLNKAHQLS